MPTYSHTRSAPAQYTPTTPSTRPDKTLLGALMLAASAGALAQASPEPAPSLSTVVVEGRESAPAGKYALRALRTQLGKGTQELRDIPQTVTVMTEKLMDDRNLEDLRQVLKTTAGVTFQAGETGEEDVRMRGFSLQQAGDIYVDGLRDAPLVERDTFNLDRVEVLKGSASMLFGKGSTGGVVNQVSKQPFLMDQHELNTIVGSGKELRVSGDFNFKTGDNAALRLNLMQHDADKHGAEVHKKGVAAAYRWGIGLKDEFSAGFYHLETDGRPLYSHPWVIENGKIAPTLPARNYYGLSSDYLRTNTDFLTLSHKHRFGHDSELKTTLRHGHYERDLWASAIAFCRNVTGVCAGQNITALDQVTDSTVLLRNPKGRRVRSDVTQLQSDYTDSFTALGRKHSLIAGVEVFDERAQRNNSASGGSLAATPELYATLVGTPNSGVGRPDTRQVSLTPFNSRTLGVYAQDTVALTDTLKLLGGLRLDRFDASYQRPDGSALNILDNLLSQRLGLIFQPHDSASYYASYGTSYNTSGDTYQYAVATALTDGSNNAKLLNTPPEKSRNVELGAKFELFEKKASLGVALFHSEKYNERNTDEPTADSFVLSGKRHATGMEFNLAGRLTPAWELFFNHTWIPLAQIDSGAGTGNAQRPGDRPALTPRHSASLWSTWRLAPAWRVGLGLNYRGEQSPEGNRTVKAQAFTTADAMAEYTVSESTSLKLNVSNLNNTLYADSLYRGFYGPGAPRNVQLALKTLF